MDSGGTPLPTVNEGATIADHTVEDIVSIGEGALENAIIAAEPVMGTPVLKQLWEAVLRVIFSYFGNFIGKFAGYVVIDVQRYTELISVAAAQADLNAAKLKGNKDDIAKADAKVDQAVAPILHYIGAIRPK